MRRLIAVAFVLSRSANAFASPSTLECTSAYEEGQELQLAQKWLQAKARFDVCSQPECPKVVVQDCAKWRDEVTSHVAITTPVAQADDGKALVGVRVFVDGVEMPVEDGTLTLEPGRHEFRFSAAHHEDSVVAVELSPGERRPVVGILKASPALPKPEASTAVVATPVPPSSAPKSQVRLDGMSIGFAAFSLVALGSSLALGLHAKSDYQSLKNECAPSCSKDQTSSLRNQLLFANVAGAVGIAASAVTIYLVFFRGPAGSVALHVSPSAGTFARLNVEY